MRIKTIFILFVTLCVFVQPGLSQEKKDAKIRILFKGLVMDASDLSPLANAQIFINKYYSSVSERDGSFAFYVNMKDTIIFRSLGYKSTTLYLADSLSGREFIAGIYMTTDTLSIGEVVIVPRFVNLKSEIMNSRITTSTEMENARYNVAVSAYQGRNSISKLGDPANNYEILRQQQKVDAYERGGIPSDKMIGLSPFMIIPAAYLLLHGLPEKPASYTPQLTDQEIDLIHEKYLEKTKDKR